MTTDEIDGLVNSWPTKANIPVPDKDIEDYMVHIRNATVAEPVTPDTTDIAGPPVIMGIRHLVKFLKGVFAKAKMVGPQIVKVIKTGSRPATPKSQSAAKSSSMVRTVLKDHRFLDCLSATAGTAAGAAVASSRVLSADVDRPAWRNGSATVPRNLTTGVGVHPWRNASAGVNLAAREEIPQKNIEMKIGVGLTISIDWSRTDDHSIKPLPEQFADRTITLVLGVDTDADDSTVLVTYPHEYRGMANRLNYETCVSTKPYWDNDEEDFDNSVTDVEVWGGCCIFYDDGFCEPETALFAIEEREDGQLRDNHNDVVSSVWCTFEHLCKGGPGEDRV